MTKELLKDRIVEYLKVVLSEYIFDELSEDYLRKAGAEAILKGIPVPIHRSDLLELTNVKIAHAMAVVIGCDINFPHKENYVEYIIKSFGKDFVKPLIHEGVEHAIEGETLKACALFRGALQIDSDSFDAMYCYARACKDTYENGEGEDFVGSFKAEALHSFERTTIMNPDFAPGFYYLGYAYLNLGLYMKAKLTFEEYLKTLERTVPEETSEIPLEAKEEQEIMEEDVREWIKRLKDPVIIEKGYNMILSERYVEGIDVLMPYVDDERYKDWWPLYYYIGLGFKELELYEDAEQYFQEALKRSPSDISIMQELVDVYMGLCNREMVEKYENKILVVERNKEEEKAQRNANFS